MPSSYDIWRVGYHANPVSPTPREVKKVWESRFDDPDKEFLTFYCAQEPITGIREVLQGLRPSSKMRSDIVSLSDDFADLKESIHRRRTLGHEWRDQHLLVSATITSHAEVVDLEEPKLRTHLEKKHADILAAHNLPYLDLSELRGRKREVTQILARDLFEEGAAGIMYCSHLDGKRCYAFFEDRYNITFPEIAIPMTEDSPPLLEVCNEWELILG